MLFLVQRHACGHDLAPFRGGRYLAARHFTFPAARVPGAASRRSHWLRLAIILAIILAVAAGAGAVQLLPSYEYGRLTMRFIDGGPIPATHKIPYSRLHPGMWPQSIVSPLLPTGFDMSIGGGEKWSTYIGVLPLFLAVAAM